MTTREIPFNSDVGVTSYMGPSVLSGATLTSPTLNLDYDTIYEFEGSLKLGASADVYLEFNTDSVTGNYDHVVIGNTGAGGTSLTAATANDPQFRTGGASGDVMRFTGKILKDVEGHPFIEIGFSILSTTAMVKRNSHYVWRTTTANVVAFRFRQSTGSFTSGQLYVTKKSPLTALNNATNLDVTANPSNPMHGQRVRRTNLPIGPTWVTYDATIGKWLSDLVVENIGNSDGVNGTATIAPHHRIFSPDYDLYIISIKQNVYVSTTNSGSSYWTFTWTALPSTAANFNTSTHAPNVFVDKSTDIGVIAPSYSPGICFQLDPTKTGAPGAKFIFGKLYYRLVIP